MKIIRAKIITFWLLLALFCFLLWSSWQHRLLWIAIFVPAWIVVGLIKPRFRDPPAPWTLLFRVGLVLMLVTVFVHALQPSSSGLTLLTKIVCGLVVIPRLCFQAYRDYTAFKANEQEA